MGREGGDGRWLKIPKEREEGEKNPLIMPNCLCCGHLGLGFQWGMVHPSWALSRALPGMREC